MFATIRKLIHYILLTLTIAAVLFSGTANAIDLLINGFGTVCASKSDVPKEYTNTLPAYPFATQLGTVLPYTYSSFTRPSYVGAERRWNFLPNSKFGLQFTSIFDAKFKAVVQILGRSEFMTSDNFDAKMDWAYLQYNYNNDLDFQFGRFRMPSFYYSDYLEVNHAQPWVMPPDEVYFIVGTAFRNVDGIKGRYSYYIGDWTIGTQLYTGTMQEDLSILGRDITVKVRDLFGGAMQIDNDYFTLRGSVLRSIYDTNLNDPLQGLVTAANKIAVTPQSTNLGNMLVDDDVSIIYVGLAIAFNYKDFNFLAERASILSPGIISTARVGNYAALTYAWRDFAFTFTAGFSRPLQTEYNKVNAVAAFIATPQYQIIDRAGLSGTTYPASGAGNAIVQQFRSYLGRQKSYALDVRYDILPSLALKGSVKYIIPCGQNTAVKYILNRIATVTNVWVYRASFDFVF